MLQIKKEKEDALRAKFEEASQEEIKLAPEINKKSKAMSRSVNDMFSWNDARKAKLEARIIETQQEESAAITGRPVVTKYAQKLRSSDGVSSSSTGAVPIEERLLDYEERKKLKLQQMIEQKQSEMKRQASTSFLAPHSASVQRSGDVADRLYNLASVQQRERQELTTMAHAHYAFDESTGQRLFQVFRSALLV